jgi:hypothetical protein
MQALKVMWLAMAGVLAAGVAAADPSIHCPDDAAVQTALFAGESGTVACVGQTPACVVVESGEVVPHPRAADAETEVRMEGGALAACAGKKCRKLGKKLRAQLTAKLTVQLSKDLAIAILTEEGRSGIWDIARDRKLAPNPGKELASAPMHAELVGGAIVATWNPCGGPCAVARLVDRSGKVRGPVFGGGNAIDIDGRRIAIATEDADRSELVVIDTKAWKLVGAVKLGDAGMIHTALARLSGDRLAVMFGSTIESGYQVATVSLKGKPKIDSTVAIECAP